MAIDTSAFDHALSDKDATAMSEMASRACKGAAMCAASNDNPYDCQQSKVSSPEIDAMMGRLHEALFGERSVGVLVLRNVLGKTCTNDNRDAETNAAAHRDRLIHFSQALAASFGKEVLPQSADLSDTVGFVEQHDPEVDASFVQRTQSDPKLQHSFKGWHLYRGYRNNKAQKLHTDAKHNADVVIMSCISQAASGGASKVCAVSDIIQKLSPTSVNMLCKPIPYACNDEFVPAWGGSIRGSAPLIAKDEYKRDTLQYSINLRKNIEHGLAAHARQPVDESHYFNNHASTFRLEAETENHPQFVKIFSSQVRAALDDIEKVANTDDVFQRVTLKPGDILVLDNRRYLHARDSFEDCAQQRRLLLRFWIRVRSKESIKHLFKC